MALSKFKSIRKVNTLAQFIKLEAGEVRIGKVVRIASVGNFESSCVICDEYDETGNKSGEFALGGSVVNAAIPDLEVGKFYQFTGTGKHESSKRKGKQYDGIDIEELELS